MTFLRLTKHDDGELVFVNPLCIEAMEVVAIPE